MLEPRVLSLLLPLTSSLTGGAPTSTWCQEPHVVLALGVLAGPHSQGGLEALREHPLPSFLPFFLGAVWGEGSPALGFSPPPASFLV